MTDRTLELVEQLKKTKQSERLCFNKSVFAGIRRNIGLKVKVKIKKIKFIITNSND